MKVLISSCQHRCRTDVNGGQVLVCLCESTLSCSHRGLPCEVSELRTWFVHMCLLVWYVSHASVQEKPMCGDDFVATVVANIKDNGICLHFRSLFNDLCPFAACYVAW